MQNSFNANLPDDAIDAVKSYLLNLQNTICDFVKSEDPSVHIQEDQWQHGGGGGGITRILVGEVFEKGGVNFSHVSGASLPAVATTKRPEFAHARFQATGVSVVLHPYNPFVPTTHCNVRFITVEKNNQTVAWWFGGGFDLTPYYGYQVDCRHWHLTAKNACDPFGLDLYPKFKKWADDYFYLPHRQEHRGIGGLFFDDFNTGNFVRDFALLQSIGEHFVKAYQPIVARRKLQPFTVDERNFQLYRRGRYVEFNLVYDRGTLFGLQSGGRIESILMSLPPLVSWQYNSQPEKDSREEVLYQVFLKPATWI